MSGSPADAITVDIWTVVVFGVPQYHQWLCGTCGVRSERIPAERVFDDARQAAADDARKHGQTHLAGTP